MYIQARVLRQLDPPVLAALHGDDRRFLLADQPGQRPQEEVAIALPAQLARSR